MKSLFKLAVVNILVIILFSGCRQSGNVPEDKIINIDLAGMEHVATIDERYQSFNVEMVEVIGGNFWIPYDKIDSARKVSQEGDNIVLGESASLFMKMPPVNLYDKRLRMLASALAPTYMRVSGSWANSTWFQDNDDPKMEKAPDGFNNVLSRKEWKGVVDFSNAVDAKLVTSFAISSGARDIKGIWTSVQAQALVDYTKSVGGKIAAAELFNEPTYAGYGDAPAGYNASTFARDIDVFRSFVNKSLPEMIILGPGSVGEGGILPAGQQGILSTDDLMIADPKPVFDAFSYHFYGAVSKRCAPPGVPGTISPDQALSQEWLNKTVTAFNYYKRLRDKYLPGAPIWLTETADAACGGNPWAATFLDSFRYVEQLARLAKCGVQVVMHNTLSASEYGLLEHDTYKPRPNYWTALLWNRLMGTVVYDADSTEQGVDIFAHSLKNNPKGIALLIVNTLDSSSYVKIPSRAEQFMLTADELQTKKVRLNGVELAMTANDELPAIKGKPIKKGIIQIPAHSITFMTFISLK